MGAGPEPIGIVGIREFQRDLKKISDDLPGELREVLNTAAGLVVDWAVPRVPAGKSGKARRSVRATSTRTAAKVTGGGARTAYYPWLDFGGRVGRKRSVHRPFLPGGRYIYAGYQAVKVDVQDELAKGLVRLAEQAGWTVQDG